MVGLFDSAENIKKMRQEAIRRVSEMHSRSTNSNVNFTQNQPSKNHNPTNLNANLNSHTNNTIAENTPQSTATPKADEAATAPLQKPETPLDNLPQITQKSPDDITKSIQKHNQKNKFDNELGSKTKREPKAKPEAKKGLLQSLPNVFDKLFEDKDKTLILTLIIILMGEEDNIMMLMAMVYLLI